ncbi:hypothetical protein C6W92_16535 [Roseovarius sp. A46]|uniref:glycosyltransferase n=1 Tax=Roseovarius sp. A46 TaxID=2109331 RepID=UPI001010A7E8|nr:glycosyltransferase [Roseovarius sp. A46]RXV58631.1 hypothetical protein C6W92_16535 [Roseovarius sp. A46]
MSSEVPHIHWVSPLPPAETDIAHYTQRILPALRARADVTLWTDAFSWSRDLEASCAVRRLNPATITPAEMRSENIAPGQAEVAFVQIGNSGDFHSSFLQLARRMPTVVVLHDLALQEMYFQTIAKRLMSLDDYLESIAHWYGDAARSECQLSWEGQEAASTLSQRIPGFELLMENAVAVVTHTSTAHAAVTDRAFVPAYQLELPYKASATATCERAGSGPLRLMQFGYINPNRRLEEVLEALAGLGPDFDFVFDICGKLWDPERIKQKRDHLGLTGKVHLHGFVPEPQLDAMLAEAHLVFNLRNPSMGEASGSQLRIWNAAATSVVTDDGWYRDVPENTVFRIPKENEVASLQALLQQLSQDRHMAAEKGAEGRKRLLDQHVPDRYGEGIVHVAQTFGRDARDAVLADAARRFLAGNSASADLMRDRLSTLFG